MLKQTKMELDLKSKTLYEKLIPKKNLLRQIKELVSFDFVYDELEKTYSISNGRKALDPKLMFKYLLLKIIFNISDEDVVERSVYDLSFKYFLDLNLDDKIINPSSLSKFRKLRLKNSKLLDLLINLSVKIGIEKGVIRSTSIIVDSTHTVSRYHNKSQRQLLLDQSKALRKSIYKIDESKKEFFPPKINNGILEDEIEYCKKLIEIIHSFEGLSNYPKVKENINLLNELINDDLEQLNLCKDKDAKVGHKSADTSFFGYKTHIAMTEERIISGAVVTTGEKHDGKQLEALVKKSIESGIKVKTIIGDKAYSEKANIEFSNKNDYKLVSGLSKTVTHGNERSSGKFDFNKDADMYVCKAGFLSIRKTVNGKKKHLKEGTGMVETYFFDVEKCKKCKFKEGCYKEDSKTKSYSVTIKSHVHQRHEEFQSTEFFKEKSKERYKIEAKNSELKNVLGNGIAKSNCLEGIMIQGAVSIFVANIKRILKLI